MGKGIIITKIQQTGPKHFYFAESLLQNGTDFFLIIDAATNTVSFYLDKNNTKKIGEINFNETTILPKMKDVVNSDAMVAAGRALEALRNGVFPFSISKES